MDPSLGAPALNRRLERSCQTSRAACLVTAGACLFLLAQWKFSPTVGGAGPEGWLYPVLEGSMAGLSLLAAALLTWAPRPWMPGLYAGLVLAFGVALAWVDLHFLADYLAFAVACLVLGLLWSAPLWAYIAALGAALGTLLILLWTTLPEMARSVDPGTLVILAVVGAAVAGILEGQRRYSDQLADRLEGLNTELRELSYRDALTGLHNRRFLVDALERERALAVRHPHPLSVALLDLDHFKRVNDTLGHGVGDEVLTTFGRVLLKEIRESDLAIRYGGEEFVLVLPWAALEPAVLAVERILDRVRATEFPGVPWRLTFSAGVVTLEAGEGATQLLARADLLLYQAKEGRNRVVGGLNPGASGAGEGPPSGPPPSVR